MMGAFVPLIGGEAMYVSYFKALISTFILSWSNATTTKKPPPPPPPPTTTMSTEIAVMSRTCGGNLAALDNTRPIYDEKREPIGVSVSEMIMAMRRLGISNEFEEEERVFVNGVDVEGMFEEEEPSLEEIMEVFKVFDENKDGCIDAKELGRVLCSLGLIKEGSDIERCKKMIVSFDRNGDGLLDFTDFLKFMEICLC